MWRGGWKQFDESADGVSGDPESLTQTLVAVQMNLMQAGSESEMRGLATDSGYHENEMLAQCAAWGIRTYISEKDESQSRVWGDKPAEQERAFRNNRRRIHGRRGRRLQRLRRVLCERSFAHTCETGAGRRSWLRAGERRQALRDSRGGAQPGRAPAEAVRGRHAAKPAGSGRDGLRGAVGHRK
ncbi:MAG: hypothetical protein AMXMBFR47_39140 [Planctomycetota bacterium]